MMKISNTNIIPNANQSAPKRALTPDISLCGKNQELSSIALPLNGVQINSVKSDIQNFQKLISKYEYGKKSLVQNPESLRVYTKDGDVYLENFHNPDKDVTEGICEELTYKAGKELEQKYGDRYIFLATKGSCKNYNMSHYFITAIRRTEENEAKIQTLKQKTLELADLAQALMDSISSDAIMGDSKIAKTLNKKSSELDAFTKELLPNAILIDPSFHTVKQYQSDGTIDNYSSDVFFDFEDMNPFKDKAYKIPCEVCEHGFQIPLGYAKDIAPDLDLDPDKMVMLFMMPDLGKVMLEATATSANSFKYDILDLDDNSILTNFIERIQR